MCGATAEKALGSCGEALNQRGGRRVGPAGNCAPIIVVDSPPWAAERPGTGAGTGAGDDGTEGAGTGTVVCLEAASAGAILAATAGAGWDLAGTGHSPIDSLPHFAASFASRSCTTSAGLSPLLRMKLFVVNSRSPY